MRIKCDLSISIVIRHPDFTNCVVVTCKRIFSFLENMHFVYEVLLKRQHDSNLFSNGLKPALGGGGGGKGSRGRGRGSGQKISGAKRK